MHDAEQYVCEKLGLLHSDEYRLRTLGGKWLDPQNRLCEEGVTEENNSLALRKAFITTDPNVERVSPAEIEQTYLHCKHLQRRGKKSMRFYFMY